jgi:hypothetical protein
VKDEGSALTAFRTRAALVTWLSDRRLSVASEIPPEGERGYFEIIGGFSHATYTSYDEFFSIQGKRRRIINNAEYTLCILQSDESGRVTENVLNPNCRDRPIFEYASSQEMQDAGL